MEQAEYEAFKIEDRQKGRIVWYTILVICIGTGTLIGEYWSYAVGIPVAVVMFFVGREVHLRLIRVRLLSRFPELRDQTMHWRRTSYH